MRERVVVEGGNERKSCRGGREGCRKSNRLRELRSD